MPFRVTDASEYGKSPGMSRSSVVVLLALVLSGCGARTIEDFGLDEQLGEVGTTSDTGTSGSDAVFPPGEDAIAIADDGPIAVDAGPPSRPITCGMSTCASATQECCVPIDSMGPPSCTPIGKCAGLALSCSSSSSCGAGLQCCLSERTVSAVCKPSCAGGMEGDREIALCTTNAECPTGLRCRRLGAGLSGCIRG